MGCARGGPIWPGLVNLSDEDDIPVKPPVRRKRSGRMDAAVRILVVEDEPRLAALIQRGLHKQGTPSMRPELARRPSIGSVSRTTTRSCWT